METETRFTYKEAMRYIAMVASVKGISARDCLHIMMERGLGIENPIFLLHKVKPNQEIIIEKEKYKIIERGEL